MNNSKGSVKSPMKGLRGWFYRLIKDPRGWYTIKPIVDLWESKYKSFIYKKADKHEGI